MRLIPVNPENTTHLRLLYDLLEEREPEQSISHKRMPTMVEHCNFVDSNPYMGWFLIEAVDSFVGACYITHQRELGISIFKQHRGNGYAKESLRMLMSRYPGRHLANINPQNVASIGMFTSLGFTGPIQITMEKTDA